MRSARSFTAAVSLMVLGVAVGTACSDNTTGNNPNDGGGGDGASDSSKGGLGADASRDGGAPAEGGGSDSGRSDAGGKEVVYANSGFSLNTFDLSPVDGTLTPKGTLALPQTLTVADFDPSFRHLYVAATTGTNHYLYPFTIDQSSGLLTALGTPVVSPHGRVLNLSLSGDDKYFLAVHNVTRTYSVFNVASDGTLGTEQPQADGGDTNVGAYLHQIRMDPSGQYVIICDRGNDPATQTTDAGVVTTPADSGHLLVFSFSSGVLSLTQDILFPDGIGPRHLDFHPTKPWIYVAAERGNRLIAYSFQSGKLTEIFNKTSLAVVADATLRNQRTGEIKVDPSGRFLWVTNRNLATTPDPVLLDAGADAPSTDGAGVPSMDGAGVQDAAVDGAVADGATPDAGPTLVFAGGENNVALFAIDPTTGEPTFVDAVDSHGFEPRTFALDASGRFIVVGNQRGMVVRQGAMLTRFATNLAVFQVAVDGRLSFLKSYDQPMGDIFWVGSAALGGP